MSPKSKKLLASISKLLKKATEQAKRTPFYPNCSEFAQRYARLLNQHRAEASRIPRIAVKRDQCSGHVWVRVAGLDIELYDCDQVLRYWDIHGIYKSDGKNQLINQLNFLELGNDQVVYSTFKGQVIPSHFHSLKAAVQWVRYVSARSQPYNIRNGS